MKRRAGQVGLIIGYALHHIGLFILTVFLVLMLAFGLLAYRLSLGPVQIPYLASQLATAASGQGITIHIGEAALAWAGYRKGAGTPLYLRLGNITASNAVGVVLASIPDARLVFLPGALLGSDAPIMVNSADAHFNGSDVAVSMRAAIRLNLGFKLSQADLAITLGPGGLGAAGNNEPISGGGFALHVTPREVSLMNGELTLVPHGNSAPHLGFSGSGHLDQDWRGTLVLTADAVQAADLPFYWPPKLAWQARRWVTTNITAGTGHDARITVGLSAPRNLSRLALAGVSGGFQGSAISLTWLPHAAQITDLDGYLAVLDADNILITAARARLGDVRMHDATMKITGVDHKDQDGILNLALDGSVPGVIAVLNAPPLSLLRQAPKVLTRATGTVTAKISTTLPLKDKLKLAQVELLIDAMLTNVAMATPLAGLGFNGGNLKLQATTKGLTVSGTAQLAGQRAVLAVRAAFQSRQVLRSLDLKTSIGPALLKRYGLTAETALTDAVQGVVPVELRVDADTAGGEAAVLRADLTPATLGVPMLGWTKQAGAAGSLRLTATVNNDASLRIDSFDATAPALEIHGLVEGGTLKMREINIGRTLAQGDITPPATASAPWQVNLSGQVLDLRAILNPPSKGQAASSAMPSATPLAGPGWQVSLRFAQLGLARDPAPGLRNFSFTGSGKGSGVLAAAARAQTDDGQPVDLSVMPASADARLRRFHLGAGNGGNLLRALGSFDDLRNGVVVLDGTYGSGAAFIGTLTVTKFSLLGAPAVGKILQAITIYGAPEAAAGPGLVFNKLVVPFSIAKRVLTLSDARAYSASLGFTASGTVGLDQGDCDLNATIIPAYALNTLPGRIPVIGRLFSAEKGGGLFAVRARITGTLSKPAVSINPLSALMPGALRDIFNRKSAAPK